MRAGLQAKLQAPPTSEPRPTRKLKFEPRCEPHYKLSCEPKCKLVLKPKCALRYKTTCKCKCKSKCELHPKRGQKRDCERSASPNASSIAPRQATSSRDTKIEIAPGLQTSSFAISMPSNAKQRQDAKMCWPAPSNADAKDANNAKDRGQTSGLSND